MSIKGTSSEFFIGKEEAHTCRSIYKKDIAIVLTNRYFTAQAIEDAKTLGVKLWNRDTLLKLLSTAE